MKSSLKTLFKETLGRSPTAAELYWRLYEKSKPLGGQNVEELVSVLPQWAEVARQRSSHPTGKRILLFASLTYWLIHAAYLGLALRARGERVYLAFLPYHKWKRPLEHFDLLRMDAYTRRFLAPAADLLHPISLLHTRRSPLTPEAEALVRRITELDAQYGLQVETAPTDHPFYKMRLERNRLAAETFLTALKTVQPDVVIIPNGSILEMGVAYGLARQAGITAITYEFGEQRDRVWLARNDKIMLQDTTALWQAYRDKPLTEEQWQKVQALFEARRGGALWANFARRWQNAPPASGNAVRSALNLDSRPIFLLATNVQGDSLTLEREIFSKSMAEWLRETVRYFAKQPNVQLVVRIHPGEQIIEGASLAEVVRAALPKLPENIRLVPADSKINTYDILEIAAAGLVFTTTVGLEMAMSGLPVVVAGKTHYRDRGFTLDPNSWDEYFNLLERLTSAPENLRPTEEQVKLAWKYAYHFFFDYPQPLPWHLVYLQEDIQRWPLEKALDEAAFAPTFAAFAGRPLPWEKTPPHGEPS